MTSGFAFAGPSARPAGLGTRVSTPSLDVWNTGRSSTLVCDAGTSRRTAREVMEHLQAAGVAAGMVQSTRQLLEDPHLKDRGFFMEMDHAKKGRSSPPAWRSACVNPPLGPSAPA